MHFPLRSWLTNIGRSAYDVSFYNEPARKKWASANRHLYGVLWLTSLLTTLTVAAFFVAMLPTFRSWIQTAKTDLPALFPPELVVTIKDGEVGTNMEEPYVIEFPERWKSVMDDDGPESEAAKTFKYLVTIDTKAHVEDYESYESVMLVTKTAVVYPSKVGTSANLDGETKTTIQTSFMMLNNAEDTVIDKEYYDGIVAKIIPFFTYFPAIIFSIITMAILVFPFVAAGFRLLGYFVYLLPAAGVLWLFAWLLGMKRGYQELYRLSLYGLTLPVFYGLLERLLSFHVPYVFTAIFLGWMVYCVNKMHRRKVMPG